MGTGSLTITAQREKAVDFSKPFMDFKMALILRKPDEEELNMFRFLDPFSPIVWLCTVMAVSTIWELGGGVVGGWGEGLKRMIRLHVRTWAKKSSFDNSKINIKI
jgi:ABC-type amino acid transport substrate-binding protein